MDLNILFINIIKKKRFLFEINLIINNFFIKKFSRQKLSPRRNTKDFFVDHPDR